MRIFRLRVIFTATGWDMITQTMKERREKKKKNGAMSNDGDMPT